MSTSSSSMQDPTNIRVPGFDEDDPDLVMPPLGSSAALKLAIKRAEENLLAFKRLPPIVMPVLPEIVIPRPWQSPMAEETPKKEHPPARPPDQPRDGHYYIKVPRIDEIKYVTPDGVEKVQHHPPPDVEVNAVDARPEAEGRQLTIAVDSGAGQSCINPDHVPEYELQPSAGQARGQHFVGAGGERMPNLGLKTVPLLMVDGVAKAATFQAAKVRKPLLAVSASCDQGQLVMFDNDISAMIERDSPEGREIRRLAKQCVAKTTLERNNGVYTISARIIPPEKLSPSDRQRMKPTTDVDMTPGFPRQGM